MMMNTEQYLNSVIADCAAAFDVSEAALYGKTRYRDVKYARWAVWAIMRENGYGLKQLGEIFGGYHHTTVGHALEYFRKDCEKIPLIRDTWERLSRKHLPKTKTKHVSIF